jgi:hypothetical protein
MSVKLGILSKFLRNTATYDAAAWGEVDRVRDVQVAAAWDLPEASARMSRVKTYAPTQMDITATVTVRNDTTDAGYLALRSASLTGAAIDVMILSGPISETGSFGFRGEFHVSLTGQDQSIGSVIYDVFDLRPATTGRAVKSANVTAPNVVTFADIGV